MVNKRGFLFLHSMSQPSPLSLSLSVSVFLTLSLSRSLTLSHPPCSMVMKLLMLEILAPWSPLEESLLSCRTNRMCHPHRCESMLKSSFDPCLTFRSRLRHPLPIHTPDLKTCTCWWRTGVASACMCWVAVNLLRGLPAERPKAKRVLQASSPPGLSSLTSAPHR